MPNNIPAFDDLVALSKQNPQELEALRTRLCDQLIDSAPEPQRRRLRGLQFQIDMERRKASNPMAACLRISEMMHASFDELRHKLNEATGSESNLPRSNAAKRASAPDIKSAARVLNFPST